MSEDLNYVQWAHAPLHKMDASGTYMVTAGTYHKQHLFRGPERLNMLQTHLLTLANKYAWKLQAWAIFSNHYHFVAQSSEKPENLRTFLNHLHGLTAIAINLHDNMIGRRVWHQYWDTKLTYQNSYFARLRYVHQNPVKHGLVKSSKHYPWCSAGWFEQRANNAFKRTVNSYKIDSLNVYDEF